MSDPRGGLGDGESGCECVCQAFLTDAFSCTQSCVVLVATQMLGTKCASAQYQDRTGLTAPTGRITGVKRGAILQISGL